MDLPMRIYTLLLLVFFPIHSNGFPNGNVEKACETMIPQHGVDAQPSFSLYSLSFSSVNHTEGLGFIVTLRKHPITDDFKGFMIQARAPNGNKPQGRFIVSSSDAQTLTCTTQESAVSHTSPILKSNVSVLWLPTGKASTDLQFRATVVQSKNIIWTTVFSDIIPLAGLGSQLLAPALHHLLLCSAALIYALFAI
ncbi:putative ferric-chelate reductase 1 isoform 2-T6 [Leptodactylus fuscus]